MGTDMPIIEYHCSHNEVLSITVVLKSTTESEFSPQEY